MDAAGFTRAAVREIVYDKQQATLEEVGNAHVVRSGAVLAGYRTPATPDGRLAGTPVANSVTACKI